MFRKMITSIVCIGLTACQGQNMGNISGESLSSIQRQFHSDADKAFADGDYKKSAEIYGNLAENHPSDTALRFKWAEALRMGNEVDSSLKAYDMILQTAPENLDAMEGKGLALVQAGDFKAAETLFAKIINLDGTRWRTINALGVINALQGDIEEAKLYYDMAVSVDPHNPSILNNIGLSMALSGRKQEAVSRMNEALALIGPNDIRRRKIELNLALAYGIMGHMDEAEQLLKKYLSGPAVFNNLGLYAKLNNDKALARSYLSKALAAHPVHYDKAWENLQAIGNAK
jgi:Flp pilus assembly protein TadD